MSAHLLAAWRKLAVVEVELVNSWANISTYVAIIDGQVVGALEEWGGAATKVYVDSAYRRRGVATALWKASGATRLDDQLSPSGAAWGSAMMGKEFYPTWDQEGDWADWLDYWTVQWKLKGS